VKKVLDSCSQLRLVELGQETVMIDNAGIEAQNGDNIIQAGSSPLKGNTFLFRFCHPSTCKPGTFEMETCQGLNYHKPCLPYLLFSALQRPFHRPCGRTRRIGEQGGPEYRCMSCKQHASKASSLMMKDINAIALETKRNTYGR
jgi:hypothetical protein